MSIQNNDKILNLQLITARSKDVGGLPIARVLPTRERRSIGAWCFLDHAGTYGF